MGFQITIGNVGASIDCPDSQTLLQAAIAAGIDYPYTCATGNCAACISQIEEGAVSMLPYSDNALTEGQRAEGKVLACRARPGSDVVVVWLGRGRR